MHARNESVASLILLGCVKSKLDATGAARDLYDSPLWRCRRAYAERLRVPWYILSAKHGLLAPDSRIAPYDLALSDLPAAERRAWSERVLESLAAQVSMLNGNVIEIHAGKAYVEYGLEDGLREAGAIVHRPLAHIAGIGPQRAWYSARLAREVDSEAIASGRKVLGCLTPSNSPRR